ncbi:hypothetical protein QBC44DRAFT_237626 [Cladorrhinum sp. PSN332]|nr:hypothetical protein QBC44DRAFT_237626 [Cladorrhinum sp. PSN332]
MLFIFYIFYFTFSPLFSAPTNIFIPPPPPNKIECDTTLQKYNRPAELRPLEQYLLHWLLWNNLPWDRFPKDNGNVDLVDCCENSAIWIAARNVTKWTPVNAREVAVMMSAVGNHCRQGARAKGRAWDPERIFTVEIGQEDCRRKCRH